MRNAKKILIIITLIIVIVALNGMAKAFIKKQYTELSELKLNEIKNSKTFAIMVMNDTWDGYKEYEGEEWPEGYNLAKAECVDNNGNKIKSAVTYDKETNKVTLTTNKTVYCTLYFDPNTISSLDLVTNKSFGLSQNLVGNLYRYQGRNNINNYICFGTRKKSECTSNPDKYMYRIIGINESGNLKLIKATYLFEDKVKTFIWNEKYGYTECADGACDWPNSTLFKRLNGTSNGDVKGMDGDTNIFVNSNEFNYLNKDNYWYNLILNFTWKYDDGKYPIKNGNLAYLEEEKFQKHIDSKISLMYASDYLLSCIDQNDDGTALTEEEFQNSWMYLTEDNPNESTKYEYTMVRYGWNAAVNGNLAVVVGSDPGYHVAMHYLNGNEGVRPVFYVTQDIKLYGKGTKAEPYLIII